MSLAKQLAVEDGRRGMLIMDNETENVNTFGELNDGPIARRISYARGPAHSFKTPPRPLKPSEF